MSGIVTLVYLAQVIGFIGCTRYWQPQRHDMEPIVIFCNPVFHLSFFITQTPIKRNLNETIYDICGRKAASTWS